MCTLDKLNRFTVQGYGWTALDGARVPGSALGVVRTWRPAGARDTGGRPASSLQRRALPAHSPARPPCRASGSIRSRQAEHWVGGSRELADLAYLATPSGFSGSLLNKYGLKTECQGAVKVG